MGVRSFIRNLLRRLRLKVKGLKKKGHGHSQAAAAPSQAKPAASPSATVQQPSAPAALVPLEVQQQQQEAPTELPSITPPTHDMGGSSTGTQQEEEETHPLHTYCDEPVPTSPHTLCATTQLFQEQPPQHAPPTSLEVLSIEQQQQPQQQEPQQGPTRGPQHSTPLPDSVTHVDGAHHQQQQQAYPPHMVRDEYVPPSPHTYCDEHVPTSPHTPCATTQLPEEDAAQKKAEKEAAARKEAEEEAVARKKAEEEEKAARKKVEEEEAAQKKKVEQEAAAKKAAEEEAARKRAEQEEKVRQEEAQQKPADLDEGVPEAEDEDEDEVDEGGEEEEEEEEAEEEEEEDEEEEEATQEEASYGEPPHCISVKELQHHMTTQWKATPCIRRTLVDKAVCVEQWTAPVKSKRHLVLDLDSTLVFCNGKQLYFRPQLQQFLAESSKCYNVSIYTHGNWAYGTLVVEAFRVHYDFSQIHCFASRHGENRRMKQLKHLQLTPYNAIVVDDDVNVWSNYDQHSVVKVQPFLPETSHQCESLMDVLARVHQKAATKR